MVFNNPPRMSIKCPRITDNIFSNWTKTGVQMVEIRVNKFNQYGRFFKALGGKQSPFFAGAKICFFIDVSVSHNQGFFFIKKKQGVPGALKRFFIQFVNGITEIAESGPTT